MDYASRTNEPVWKIQTCRQESWAWLSSPVPGREPIVCAKNRFSAATAMRRRDTAANKLKPSLRIVRRFRTTRERRVKTLNIVQSSHGNSLISDADRVFA